MTMAVAAGAAGAVAGPPEPAQPGGRRKPGAVRERAVVSEDDVLVPARGILDVLDNYAFVRTSGYLPGRRTPTSHCPWSRSSACARAMW